MSVKKINPFEFDHISTKVREFFKLKGLVECHVQNELSILAACEDPTTIGQFDYSGYVWPLPQTGQMHLEDLILTYGETKVPGFFCITTSYRQEANPVPGRHDLIFPMIEFEIPGDINKLQEFQREMLEYLGFGEKNSFPEGNYADLCTKYGVSELEHEHEMMMKDDFGPVFFLKNFPETTSPFWNMSRYPGTNIAKKIDVIVCGVETFGSAERSCDKNEMRKLFHNITDGKYAETLYSRFGKERVENELETFLKHDFFVRSGCGIGFTRLCKAMKQMNLL
uniref:Aminoacyl-tRNA synthetase class II (D/K/N) domain-containing protein n=1 Tax=viral metagenome TaxID=1070528 RepID=A0A6C0C758_9ZZZZ